MEIGKGWEGWVSEWWEYRGWMYPRPTSGVVLGVLVIGCEGSIRIPMQRGWRAIGVYILVTFVSSSILCI